MHSLERGGSGGIVSILFNEVLSEMARLARILLYPIKSLDPIEVASAEVLATGALKWDRTFAMLDADGKFVNGKRHAAVHGIRTHYAPDFSSATLSAPARPELSPLTFALNPSGIAPAEAWLSQYFGFAVRLDHNSKLGFPDDTDAPGPTVISTATLEEVSRWTRVSVDSCRLRFRANLELADVPAFWEDRLFGSGPGAEASFYIGAAQIRGTNPCQRCIVPTRDGLTGQPTPGFQKTFMERRKATLPVWAASDRFNHYYRLAVNTRIGVGEVGKIISVNDVCEAT